MFDKRALLADAYARSLSLGVNPYRALGIIAREGLNDNTLNSPTFGNKDARGYSYGPWQLFSGSPQAGAVAPGGDAYEFMKRYGEAPSANNWQKQNDYAIRTLARLGDAAEKKWYSVRDNGGWGNIEKIGQQVATQYGLKEGNPTLMAYAGQQTSPDKMNEGLAAISNATNGSPMQSAIIGGSGEVAEDTNPFSNFFANHGLARAGAALMAIDNPQGAAALMSGVKDADKKKPEWEYAGVTPNGKGVMFKNGKTGQLRLDPLPMDAQGPKDQNPTSDIQEYEYAKQQGYGGSFEEWMKTKKGGAESKVHDEGTLETLGEMFLLGDSTAFNRFGDEAREKGISLAMAKIEKITGERPDGATIMANRGRYQQLLSSERKFGQMIEPVQAATKDLEAAVGNAKTALKDMPSFLTKHNMTANMIMQKSAKEWQGEGAPELAKYAEALEAVSRAYSQVLGRGVANASVRSDEVARGLLNTTYGPDTVNGVLDYMLSSGKRITQSIKDGHEELRKEWKSGAQQFGSGVKKREDEILSDVYKRAGIKDDTYNKDGASVVSPPQKPQEPAQAPTQAPAQAPAAPRPQGPLTPEERAKIIEELRRRGKKV